LENDVAGVVGERADDLSGQTCEVVGVAADVQDVLEQSPGDIYFSAAQWPGASTLLVRGASPAALAELRGDIRRFDPRLVISESSLEDAVAAALWGRRIVAGMFGVLAAVGLCLAGLGMYAMLSHSAALRQREFGLRAVLGAEPRELAWLVVSENLALGAAGIALGVGLVAAGMLAVARYSPGAWAYAASVAFTAALLGAAASLSARRVLALDPGLALRRR